MTTAINRPNRSAVWHGCLLRPPPSPRSLPSPHDGEVGRGSGRGDFKRARQFDGTSPSPQPSPRSCLAGRGATSAMVGVSRCAPGRLCPKEPGEIFEAVNGGGRGNGDRPAAPIRIYCPATMRLKTCVAAWKEPSRVPSGKKTDIVAVCVSSPEVSFSLRVAFSFT